MTIITQKAKHTPAQFTQHSTQGRTPPDRAARRKGDLVSLGQWAVAHGRPWLFEAVAVTMLLEGYRHV
jgi:hypothetical protein